MSVPMDIVRAMSETYAYVACTCFRDGVSSDPPVPRSQLMLDPYGNVIMRSSHTGDDDPESLFDWRAGWDERRPAACTHHHMRLAEEIWTSSGCHDDRVDRLLEESGAPRLREILEEGRGVGSWAHVIATPDDARDALPELDRILSGSLGKRTRVVVTDDLREVAWPVDPDGYEGGADFTTLDFQDPHRIGVDSMLEVGVVEHQLVVRDLSGESQTLRADRIVSRREGDQSRQVRSDRHWHDPPRWTFVDEASGRQLHGDVSSTWPGSWYHYLQPRWSSLGLQVRERELWISDIAWYLPRLRPLLEAAVTTGNPVVQYHNGASLGFELPRLV